jgi:hypothetical protein
LAGESGEVQLIPLQVEAGGDNAKGNTDLAWELAGPSGHVLRVYEQGASQALREAVAVVARGGQRR